jgi:hypothetical protein
MARFGEENVFLGLAVPPFGHVLEQDEDARAVIVRVNEATRTDQHCTRTDRREIGSHLITNDSGSPGYDLAHKALQLGYVPLTVAKAE